MFFSLWVSLFIFYYKREALDKVAAYFLSGVVFGSTEAPFVKGAEGVVIQSAVAAGAHYYGAFYAPVNAYNATHDNAPADASITQEWDGTEMSAAIWCTEEAQHMKLREFKHSYTTRDRVLTLLLLESAEPRAWDRSWQDEESFDSFDRFVSNGQLPDRR